MTGEANCIYLKSLIPYVEQAAGPEAVAAILRTAGRSREWLVADHNWVPLALLDRLIHQAMELMGETDEEAWAHRWAEYHMDWKPSHEERSYLGAFTMGLGSPRAVYQRLGPLAWAHVRCARGEVAELHRSRGVLRLVPLPGASIPRWLCVHERVTLERFPTNWGLPRATITERECAARGGAACVYDIRWRNAGPGLPFWVPSGAGAGMTALALVSAPSAAAALPALLPGLAGVAVGFGLHQRRRRRDLQKLRDIQTDEILHANEQLEGKFRDLESKIEQLSLLIDLGAAVNATLDPERIYEQALGRLVTSMGYPAAYLFLLDPERRRLRGHRMAGTGLYEGFGDVDLALDPDASVAAKVAVTGRPVLVHDVATTTEPADRGLARSLGAGSGVAVPLRVKGRVLGVLEVVAGRPGGFAQGDVDLVTAVANHAALALDRAESFRTIEELSRGLEDKVRVRTEQLRAANEELQKAYRDLQATQLQLIQREKMASVGQLVAGVAHELNNPIGFVYSNVSMLEDFVGRLRGALDVYRGLPLPDPARAIAEERWAALKVDYALRYLDPMIQGIREGAERARKIVRDLRVFARGSDDVWQAVDLHEEIESSLTLLNHLLKDRIAVERKYGALPAVECVRSQIDQVLLNVLANAAQAIQGRGAITIETRAEDDRAVVSVADTGPGIPADVIGRVFDPFFTTKPVGEGSGLGLSISYEILEKHGGEIRAASAPGGGALFTMRLPLTRAAGEEERRSPAPSTTLRA